METSADRGIKDFKTELPCSAILAEGRNEKDVCNVNYWVENIQLRSRRTFHLSLVGRGVKQNHFAAKVDLLRKDLLLYYSTNLEQISFTATFFSRFRICSSNKVVDYVFITLFTIP